MKLQLIFAIALCACCQACNNGSQDSVDNAKKMNKDKDTSSPSMVRADTSATLDAMAVDKDASDFAVEAANGSMMEVALGKVAAARAVSARVKNFAAMMVTDHSKVGEDLKQIATSKNITLPATVSDDANKHIESMNKKDRKEFDKSYMDMMLKDHKDDVSNFEKAAKDCKDPALRNFAAQTLPVLLKHLDSAKAIAGKR